MSQQETQPPSGVADGQGVLSYQPEHELLHEPKQEDVVINRWQLKDILNRIMEQQERPQIEHALPYVGLVAAFLLPLIPADYESFLGFPGEVWTAFSLFAAVLSGIKAAAICLAVIKQRATPRKTTEDLVQEIVSGFRQRVEEHKQSVAEVPKQQATIVSPSELVPEKGKSPTKED